MNARDPHNKYPTHCMYCGRHLSAGEGILAGKTSEGSEGKWMAHCRAGIGCMPAFKPKVTPKKPINITWPNGTNGDVEFCVGMLTLNSEDDLISTGWDIKKMREIAGL